MNKNMKYWANHCRHRYPCNSRLCRGRKQKKGADSTRTDGDGKQQPDRGTVVRFGGK